MMQSFSHSLISKTTARHSFGTLRILLRHIACFFASGLLGIGTLALWVVLTCVQNHNLVPVNISPQEMASILKILCFTGIVSGMIGLFWFSASGSLD